jgi:hypothetical protein
MALMKKLLCLILALWLIPVCLHASDYTVSGYGFLPGIDYSSVGDYTTAGTYNSQPYYKHNTNAFYLWWNSSYDSNSGYTGEWVVSSTTGTKGAGFRKGSAPSVVTGGYYSDGTGGSVCTVSTYSGTPYVFEGYLQPASSIASDWTGVPKGPEHYVDVNGGGPFGAVDYSSYIYNTNATQDDIFGMSSPISVGSDGITDITTVETITVFIMAVQDATPDVSPFRCRINMGGWTGYQNFTVPLGTSPEADWCSVSFTGSFTPAQLAAIQVDIESGASYEFIYSTYAKVRYNSVVSGGGSPPARKKRIIMISE